MEKSSRATLGAIIGAAVLTNVFMLNMSYDIPVKQFSFHLLLMGVILIACDGRRLLDVFVRHRPAEPPRHTELFVTPKSKRITLVAGWALGLWMIGGHFKNEYQAYSTFGHGKPHDVLYGVFEVVEVVKNGAVQPPLMTDATRWRRLSVGPYRASVRLATDSLVPYSVRPDTAKRLATFMSGPDTTKKLVLSYAFADSTHLLLRGRIGPDSVEMTLRRRSESSYLLVSRGFHWINEVPFFR